MPWVIQKDNDKYCVHKENADGTPGEVVKCHPTEGDAKNHMRALCANVEDMAAKYLDMFAVKAVGDWELDVLAIPFHSRDSDGQWFDEETDIMPGAFSTPLVVYQHGIAQGAKRFDDKPVIVGKTVSGSLEMKSDGWHIRVILDKAVKQAHAIMEAAKKKLVAVSSGSIAHLARLDIGGKLIQYEKNRPGRIAVWALGEVSLWERGNGNVQPANQFAVALPVMKAMYKEAGLNFPSIDTGGDEQAADVNHRARVKEAKEKARNLLKKLGE